PSEPRPVTGFCDDVDCCCIGLLPGNCTKAERRIPAMVPPFAAIAARRRAICRHRPAQPLAFFIKTHHKDPEHPTETKDQAMKAAVIVFPGLNRDRDMIAALTKIGGSKPAIVWHQDADIPDADLIVIPGGFSYGDYLRCGAIAARSPIMDKLRERAAQGVKVLGVCNGFQILIEAGLLPGALMRNMSLKFVCREVKLEVVNADTDFTRGYAKGQIIRCPVAHHDGNYFADAETLKRIEGEGRVAFRYAEGTNPNGSINDIAGIFNENKNVLGLMPHPENLIEAAHGGED